MAQFMKMVRYLATKSDFLLSCPPSADPGVVADWEGSTGDKILLPLEEKTADAGRPLSGPVVPGMKAECGRGGGVLEVLDENEKYPNLNHYKIQFALT